MDAPGATAEAFDLPDQALLEIVPGGVVYVRADGTIATANGEALRVLGLSFDELTRKYTQDFEPQTIHEDGRPFPASDYPVTRALTTGEPQRGVTIGVRRPDGELSWAVFSATPVRGAHTGAVVGAIVTFLDITERKHAEDELQRSRELLRAAQRIANIGSFEVDLATGRVTWSEQMYEIHGLRPEQFDGRIQSLGSLFHPDDAKALRARIEGTMRGEVPDQLQLRAIRPSGEVRTVWSASDLVCDETGRALKIVGAVQDVTERRALEGQLRQAQRLESLGRLAGGVAHDFNNLLQVILGSAEIARRDPTRESALIEIQMAAQRAAELTRQLLAFGWRQHFQPVELSVPALIQEIMPLLRRVVGDGVEIVVHPHEGTGHVTADRGQVEQVLVNLCLNARDAMRDGGTLVIRSSLADPPRATRDALGLREAGNHLVLAVSDTGVGMSADVRARAFEPFFTTKEHGTGLGLAVVYGIVQQHRGGIDVQSDEGRGTTFVIYLPVTDTAGFEPMP